MLRFRHICTAILPIDAAGGPQFLFGIHDNPICYLCTYCGQHGTDSGGFERNVIRRICISHCVSLQGGRNLEETNDKSEPPWNLHNMDAMCSDS